MYTPSDVASCLLTWAEHAAATILEQKQEIDRLREEVDQLKAEATK